jgi:hypothetical protein
MKNTITKSVKTAKAEPVQDIVLTYRQVRDGLESLNKDAKWQIMCDGLEMLDKDDKRWTHKIQRTPRGRK